MTITEKIQQIISERNSLITTLNTKGFTIPDDTKLGDLIDIVENTDIGGVGKKAVNFYDYDGTLLHSYTRDEALALTELPGLPNRTSEGLTCQGWNWSLSDIQTELTDREDLDYLAVEVVYIPTDGATHINITFADKYRNVMPLMFTGNVTIDWGDGNTESVNHTSATTIIHEYAIAQSYPAKYTIKLTVNSGTLTLGGGSSSYNICGSTTNNASNPSRAYSSRIDSVFIGNSITSISTYAFAYCCSLTSVTIPNSVTSISNYAFRYCYSLASVAIPNSVESISTYAFAYCCSLISVTIPNSVKSIGEYAFYQCSSLASVTIQNGVTSIGSYAFANCPSIASVTIPNSVTSIGSDAFSGCYSLISVMIPNNVKSVGIGTFYDCCSIIKYDFSTHTSVPTLSNINAFNNIANDAKIVVPDTLYTTWIAATNWSTYKSKIVKVSEYREPQYVSPTIITYTDGSTTEINVGDDGLLSWQMTKGGSDSSTTNTTIQSVEIGSDVTTLGYSVLQNCSSLISTTIPSSVTAIGPFAFYGCSSLNDITFDKTMTEVSSITYYPWAISSGTVIKCTDGNITVS